MLLCDWLPCTHKIYSCFSRYQYFIFFYGQIKGHLLGDGQLVCFCYLILQILLLGIAVFIFLNGEMAFGGGEVDTCVTHDNFQQLLLGALYILIVDLVVCKRFVFLFSVFVYNLCLVY